MYDYSKIVIDAESIILRQEYVHHMHKLLHSIVVSYVNLAATFLPMS